MPINMLTLFIVHALICCFALLPFLYICPRLLTLVSIAYPRILYGNIVELSAQSTVGIYSV
jgi:hypothetical protein